MKRIAFFLLVTVAIHFAACNKHDNQRKEVWQIQEYAYGPERLFKYDHRRLLTTIAPKSPGAGPNFGITYDQFERPDIFRDSTSPSYWKAKYEGGKLTRIDQYDNSNNFVSAVIYEYDNKGRIIGKSGGNIYNPYTSYEYVGNSRNYRRANFYNNNPLRTASAAKATAAIALPDFYIEYTYDNERNTLSTLRNMPVIPVIYSSYFTYLFFDPITEANVTGMKFYGQVDTGYVNFQDHRYDYVYENHFPVSSMAYSRNYNLGTGEPGSWGIGIPGHFTYDKLRW